MSKAYDEKLERELFHESLGKTNAEFERQTDENGKYINSSVRMMCCGWLFHAIHNAKNAEIELKALRTPKCCIVSAGDYCAEELFGVGGVPTCPGCEHCNINKMFEAAYRAHATSPVYIVNDMLVKDADGEYFHLATQAAFKFFKLGRESCGK